MQSTAASNECDGDKGNAAFSRAASTAELALTGLEAAFGLVDDVNPALAANQPVVAVTAAQGFQRITDLHGTMLSGRPALLAVIEPSIWQNLRAEATRDRRFLGQGGPECQSNQGLLWLLKWEFALAIGCPIRWLSG